MIVNSRDATMSTGKNMARNTEAANVTILPTEPTACNGACNTLHWKRERIS